MTITSFYIEVSMILFERSSCDFCGVCVGVCPVDCIELSKSDLEVDQGICIDCMRCVDVCPSRSLAGEVTLTPEGAKLANAAFSTRQATRVSK